jgi:peptidoglycan/xylan/chitin deacetylase (PgdA/CDA1 family)
MTAVRASRFSLLAGLVSCAAACSEPPAEEQPGAGSGNATSGSSSGGAPGGASGNASGGVSSSGASGSSSSSGTSTGGAAGGASGMPGGGTGGGSLDGFQGGALAAVTLTYDDGLDPHLATVQPALEAAGFRGTFFLSSFEGVDHDWALPNATSPLSARHMAWQAAAQKGHELADHTVNHPCDAASKAPNWKLDQYTQARMTMELDDSIARLTRLGGTAPFTFAYPCGSDKKGIGPNAEDYSPLVAARFFAARVSDSGMANPAQVDLLHVPQLDAGAKTGDELKAMVDQAIAAKSWLVLLFHGVGSETLSCPQALGYQPQSCMINYLTTSSEAHAALVQYLADKKTEVWTATFKEVATYIASKR